MTAQKKRLASLDVLRGLDLWLLIIVGPLLNIIFSTGNLESWTFVRDCIHHVEWEGFVLWDLIMPLFMFMSGITIPFALARYKGGQKPGKDFYLKLVRRFVGLFVLGWIVQGNLLDLEWNKFHPVSNTLHAIAIGYVIGALLFVHLKPKGQIFATSAFFLLYIIGFILSGDCLRNLDPQTNIAMMIDKAVLGCHRDGVIWAEDGSWAFDDRYPYTWIFSSLNFVVTIMLGCFAGEIIRSKGEEATPRKALILGGVGAALLAGGMVMSLWFPIIKPIWSSSMTLYAGGLSFLLMAATYYIVDVRNWGGEWKCAKWFGMNSIAVYTISNVIDFSSITRSLIFGLEHLTGTWYPLILKLGNLSILIIIMKFLYDRKIFLKV